MINDTYMFRVGNPELVWTFIVDSNGKCRQFVVNDIDFDVPSARYVDLNDKDIPESVRAVINVSWDIFLGVTGKTSRPKTTVRRRFNRFIRR